jgi:hypothetical protein
LRPDLRRPCKPWPAVERNADAPRVARKVEDRQLRLKLLGLQEAIAKRANSTRKAIKNKKRELVLDMDAE